MLKLLLVKHSELAMPAGSLQCALYAFKGGADAVYVGMKNFSARKGAVNFSFEDLRKLKQICLEQEKKFYVTFNTLVQDSDFPEVIMMLKQLDYLQPDGIIIQDLGIAKLIRDFFPSLKIHASTQLAVHDSDGVKELAGLGFERVVLARELELGEIEKIRKECPDVELKVFIHGALCYGFSGVCMASEQITGRSANCGACAQICRTWFTCRETETDRWFFSMKDLKLGAKVKLLRDMGIDSLKVEGRMKGPEYVYWCARYYSLLLEDRSENDEEVKWAMENAQIAFSRETTEGFFSHEDNLICSDYPSHRGIKVGTIQKILNRKAVIRFEKPVALRDGLLVIYNGESAGFAVRETDNGKSFISANEKVTVNFPSEEFSRQPVSGTPVMCVSRHDMNLPLLNENLPLFKKQIDLKICISDNGLEVNGKFYEADIQAAKSDADLNSIITKVFSSSDKSFFIAGKIEIENKSSHDSAFIPMSVLKQIRRLFYESKDRSFENALNEKVEIPSTEIPDLPPYEKGRFLEFEPVFNSVSKEQISSYEGDTILLNNIGQIPWAKDHPQYKYIASAFLYAKNSPAFALLKEEIPSLIGRYTSDDVKVPAFISRVCFRHHSLNLPCKGCSLDNTYHLTQNGKTFTVRCKNCKTEVFMTNV